MDESELTEEIRQLRREIRRYREYSQVEDQKQRVENFQILIALGILGAAATIYSTGTIDEPFWQGILSSEYWIWVLRVFIGTTAVFLILKLVFGPLRQTFESPALERARSFWEPFFYFWGIISVLFATVVKLLLDYLSIEYAGIGGELLVALTLCVPLVAALVIGQISQLGYVVERYIDALYSANELILQFVQIGAIDRNDQTDILQYVGPALLPSVGTTTRLVIHFLKRFGNLSEDGEELLNSFESNLPPPSGFGVLGGSIARLVIAKYSSESNLSESEREEVRDLLNELRSKSIRGDLTEGDVQELINTLDDAGVDTSDIDTDGDSTDSEGGE